MLAYKHGAGDFGYELFLQYNDTPSVNSDLHWKVFDGTSDDSVFSLGSVNPILDGQCIT